MEIKMSDICRSVVTKRYPKARAQEIQALRVGNQHAWVIYDYDLVDANVIGHGATEAEAWENAESMMD